MNSPGKYLPIDEEGYPLSGELRITDPIVAREVLENVRFSDNGSLVSTFGGQPVTIEAFDQPLVARHISKYLGIWKISVPFEVEFEIDPSTLRVDDWDRFHGLTKANIPFVLNRQAQTELFSLCQDYDDDSITVDGKQIPVLPLMRSDAAIKTEGYWSQVYQTETPGWELEQASPALVDMLPRLKLPKSRILVLGCGSGNDAAFFAKDGHWVTAVDFSPEAIQRAKAKYGQLTNIKWVQADAFELPDDFAESFDLIFEHTCFCAIPPEKRNDLIQVWRECLTPKGYLLAVLFTMDSRSSPPFGGSEWEYRERLKKYFQFIFWGRWRQSIARRDGKELLIYAQLK